MFDYSWIDYILLKQKLFMTQLNVVSVWVYMYECVCIYIFTYTHTHTYIYIFTYTHTHIYIYIFTYTHTHIYIYIYSHIHTHTYQQKWVQPLGKVVNINIHHVNSQYFVWPPSLSRTGYTLLGREFTRVSQVATEMLFHSSMTTSRSWQIFDTSTFRLRIPQRCSVGFKSGDMLGQLYPQPLQ